MKRALALCRADDPCFAPVAAAMARHGGELIRVDLSTFPHELSLALSIGEGQDSLRFGDIDLNDAEAVWIRHVDVAESLPPMEPSHRAATENLANTALHAALQSIEVFQLDPPDRMGNAPLKPRQGQLARRAGLAVPRTLVSNDPDAIRAFAARCGGQIIAKMLDSGSVMMEDEDGAVPFPTMLMRADELDELPGIELSPMIFQELVPKRLEARVTIVGREVFVAAVPVTDAVDMRQDRALIEGLRAFDGLPRDVVRGLEQMMDRVGLNFATFDLINTPDDRWVYLEMNTVSYFHHVERFAGLPVSDAVARLLLGLAPTRDGQR